MRTLFALGLAGLALSLTACVGGRSPEARFFQLQPVPPAADAPAIDPSIFIAIKNVNLEAYLRQPRMAERINSHEVRYREFRRWAEPLDRNITRVITENLRQLLKTELLATTPPAGEAHPVLSLQTEIKRFERQPDGRVLLSASWLIQPPHTTPAPSKAGTADLFSMVVSGDASDITSAQSTLLSELSARIASDLRTFDL
jgi:uncharacterized lipoprotein YmbA